MVAPLALAMRHHSRALQQVGAEGCPSNEVGGTEVNLEVLAEPTAVVVAHRPDVAQGLEEGRAQVRALPHAKQQQKCIYCSLRNFV